MHERAPTVRHGDDLSYQNRTNQKLLQVVATLPWVSGRDGPEEGVTPVDAPHSCSKLIPQLFPRRLWLIFLNPPAGRSW
jgi:hypothetical protein